MIRWLEKAHWSKMDQTIERHGGYKRKLIAKDGWWDTEIHYIRYSYTTISAIFHKNRLLVIVELLINITYLIFWIFYSTPLPFDDQLTQNFINVAVHWNVNFLIFLVYYCEVHTPILLENWNGKSFIYIAYASFLLFCLLNCTL